MSLEQLAKRIAEDHLKIDPRHWKKSHHGAFNTYQVEHPEYKTGGKEHLRNDANSVFTVATPHGYSLELYGGLPYTLELEIRTEAALQRLAIIRPVSTEIVDSPSNILLQSIATKVQGNLWNEFFTLPVIHSFRVYGEPVAFVNAVAYLTLGCPDLFQPSNRTEKTGYHEWERDAQHRLAGYNLTLIRGKGK